jgi:hypothetical protein
MPQSSITFNPTFRDIRGRFARADANMLRNKQEAVRVLGRRWVEIAKEEAPVRSGKFRKSINFHVFAKNTGDKSKAEVGFTTSSQQPLGRWIVGGTRPHRIYARNKKALYFFWGKVGMYTVVPRSGGFSTHVSGGKYWIGKGYVNHPGTKPNPYLDRTYGRWVTEMEREIENVADRFVIDLVGK